MKNYALEGLRGLAAVMVLLSHLMLVFWPTAHFNTVPVPLVPWQVAVFNSPLTFFYSGNLAVCIFFVMSGYVLTAKFWRTGNMLVIADLAARRYIRLTPPILLSLLIGYALVRFGLITVHQPGAPVWSTSTYGSQPSFLRTLEDGLWRVYFKDDTNAYNPVMWTMKIEFLGSMLTFGLALLLSHLRFRFAIYALVSLAMLATVKDGAYYCLFVFGIALADSNPKAIKTLPAAVLLALAVWLGGYRDGSISHAPLGVLRIDIDGTITDTYHLCNAISGAIIVYLALCSPPMARMLAQFKEIGRRSFSLYLTHFAILGSLGIAVYLKLKSVGWRDDSAAIAAAIVTCAVSYIVAGWYATWIDEKSVQASRLATIIVDSVQDERSTTLPGSTQRS